MKFILLLLFVLVLSQKDDLFPIHGVYCGLYHTSLIGEEPVDSLDRFCQYHDICVTSLGYFSCFCNEQLYFLTMNFIPNTSRQITVKNDILFYIHWSIIRCTNHHSFDTTFHLAPYAGFHYLPFYPGRVPVKYKVNSEKNVKLITVFPKYYLNFTTSLLSNFPKLPDFAPYWRLLDDKKDFTFVTSNYHMILFQEDPSPISVTISCP